MRNIGMVLFLSCVGAAGCSNAGGGGLGQSKQAEAEKLVTCSYDTMRLCTTGYTCVDGPNWHSIEVDGPGICVDKTAPPLDPCGGLGGLQCSDGFTCVDDPTDSCAPESGGADCAGICVEKTDPPPQQCGGFANLQCPSGLTCVDDPSDDCDPQNGGADCGGICVKP